ncbi:hypothetical protein T492DRAFT_1132012 [Pavlovales sp. CCMP2436]|nr:hypothetical protein T492DRAFT_1132012 [Pavlovales sp. CCMP2436]
MISLSAVTLHTVHCDEAAAVLDPLLDICGVRAVDVSHLPVIAVKIKTAILACQFEVLRMGVCISCGNSQETNLPLRRTDAVDFSTAFNKDPTVAVPSKQLPVSYAVAAAVGALVLVAIFAAGAWALAVSKSSISAESISSQCNSCDDSRLTSMVSTIVPYLFDAFNAVWPTAALGLGLAPWTNIYSGNVAIPNWEGIAQGYCDFSCGTLAATCSHAPYIVIDITGESASEPNAPPCTTNCTVIFATSAEATPLVGTEIQVDLHDLAVQYKCTTLGIPAIPSTPEVCSPEAARACASTLPCCRKTCIPGTCVKGICVPGTPAIPGAQFTATFINLGDVTFTAEDYYATTDIKVTAQFCEATPIKIQVQNATVSDLNIVSSKTTLK